MKLKSFEIHGLLGRTEPMSATLSDDLNILTGRNGAGKTTALKLVWYIMSGNLLLALEEVDFQKATIVTDLYKCTLYKLSRITCRVDLSIGDESWIYEDVRDEDGDVFFNAEDQAIPRLTAMGSSVFFPTFRRIEGGFSSTAARSNNALSGRRKSDIEDALIALSRKLTNDPHVFVSSISTVDIVSLILRQYAELSEAANTLQQSTSQEIIDKIKDFKRDPGDNEIHAANKVIDSIRSEIEGMETSRETIMAPIGTVTNLVERLFTHSGIRFGTRLSVGDAAKAVNSDSLSAGEKQMLSFICYNTFYKNSVIFIDEPELSLHVDWQRTLFPMLLRQQSSNQFIIATHSPFIYSKYADKEININPDRGDALVGEL
jgi:energy-coupling factor transporter ATP-binding protein EcfA2